MPHTIPAPPATPARPSYLRPLAPDDLDIRLDDALRHRPRRHQARLCVAAYFFRQWGLAQQWGFLSQADYVRERLHESNATFCDWAYAGKLIARSSRCRAAFRHGRVGMSALALLGQRCSIEDAEAWLLTACEVPVAELRKRLRSSQQRPATLESQARSNDSDTITLRLRLPASAARYIDETLELARALSGQQLSDEQALDHVLAEASTELPAVDPDAPRTIPSELLAQAPRRRRRFEIPTAPEPPIAAPLRPRRRARYLDRVLRREHAQLARQRGNADALLLLAQHSRHFSKQGYSSFYDYTRLRLGLSKSNTAERLRAAYLAARHHPVAVARAQGQLGAVQSYLLSCLEKLGVARSSLQRWVEHAQTTTVRMLRRSVDWARNMARTRQREWAMTDYAPPGFAQVRTSELTLTQLAQNPDPPRYQPTHAEPHELRTWHLTGDEHAFLLDLVTALGQRVRSYTGRRPDGPWAILHIFHQARHAWQSAAQAMPRHPHKQVLERDHYRCQVPGCSRRKVEVHHITFRSQGGTDDAHNLICLCPGHHRHGVHNGRLRITGHVTDDRNQLRFDLGVGRSGRALLSYVGYQVASTPELATPAPTC